MKLLLTRHGETDWNLARRYQGQSDAPLNQTGIRQAEQLANRLSKETVHAIYASDLSRAAVTAQLIAASRQLEIKTDPRWRELSFGQWEGLNYAEVDAQWHDRLTNWIANPVPSAPPEGESLMQLAERVQSALDELKSNHKDDAVLVVSHSGVIQTLLCLVLGMDLKRYWQFRVLQASLTIVSFHENGAVLNLFNEISHLKALE
ncbi:MAG: alpha-ribazole phosphatase [Anaerolineaceae bacterium]|jgi:alpha-ribazole phosphatase|nr:MAG: alpha-ribazole phosphatase [Anaerolineaceae bacterium]